MKDKEHAGKTAMIVISMILLFFIASTELIDNRPFAVSQVVNIYARLLTVTPSSECCVCVCLCWKYCDDMLRKYLQNHHQLNMMMNQN